MSVKKHKDLLDKITLMAEENRLNEIKDINQSFKTGFHVSGVECDSTSTLLGLAAYEADVFLVNALVKAGADVNSLMNGYRQLSTPAHLVIYGAWFKENEDELLEDRMKILDILHENGADLQSTGGGGSSYYWWTPMATATHAGAAIHLGAKLLRLGVDPTVPSSGSGILLEYLNINPSFMIIACEEANNKYQSVNEYSLPKGLHIDVLNTLQTLQFKYSTKYSTLVTVNMEVTNDNGEGTHISDHICNRRNETTFEHTDVFDLSEVKYTGSLAIEDILEYL